MSLVKANELHLAHSQDPFVSKRTVSTESPGNTSKILDFFECFQTFKK